MKREIILSALIVFCLLASGVYADVSGGSIGLVLTSQAPYPAEPGKNVDVEVELQNTGLSEITDLNFEIDPKDPFTLLPGEEKVKIFNTITGQGSVKASYTLLVSPGTLTNEYELEFRVYKDSKETGYETKKVSVNVLGSPDLIIEDISVPDSIEPGGTSELSISLRNIGSGTARDLKLNFNSTTELIPILSKGSIYVGDLIPNQTKTAKVELSIDNSAEEKTYTAHVTAEYEDESGTEQSKSFSVGVPVKGSIQLEIIKIEPEYDRDRLNIEVANKGTTEAKAVEAKLVINGETADIDYTSSIKGTKKTTFSFPLILSGTGELRINYIGPGLEENSVSRDVVLNFPSQDGSGTVTAVVILVIIAGAGYYFWNKRKKGAHHSS